MHHTGLTQVRPYEQHPLPLSCSIPEDVEIRCVACHPHLPRIAVALADHSVHLYELSEDGWQETLSLGHQFQVQVNCMAWKPTSGSTLAVGCRAGVLLWEGDWMTRYFTCPEIGNVTSLEWSPLDSQLAVGCPHSAPVIWDTATSLSTRLHATANASSSYLLRWSPNGHYLFQAALYLMLSLFCQRACGLTACL